MDAGVVRSDLHRAGSDALIETVFWLARGARVTLDADSLRRHAAGLGEIWAEAKTPNPLAGVDMFTARWEPEESGFRSLVIRGSDAGARQAGLNEWLDDVLGVRATGTIALTLLPASGIVGIVISEEQVRRTVAADVGLRLECAMA